MQLANLSHPVSVKIDRHFTGGLGGNWIVARDAQTEALLLKEAVGAIECLILEVSELRAKLSAAEIAYSELLEEKIADSQSKSARKPRATKKDPSE